MEVSQSVMDGWCVEEHYESCPNKCYVSEYAYGASRVFINIRGHEVRFEWSYHDDIHPLRDAMDVTLKAAQRAQLEDYWSLIHGNSGISS